MVSCEQSSFAHMFTMSPYRSKRLFPTIVVFRTSALICFLIVPFLHYTNGMTLDAAHIENGGKLMQQQLNYSSYHQLASEVAPKQLHHSGASLSLYDSWPGVTQNQSISSDSRSKNVPGKLSFDWQGRSMSDYPYDTSYFDQMNAHNHKPVAEQMTDHSEPKVTISEPQESASKQNTYYYSPSAYGKSNGYTTTPKSTETQASQYVYIYPNTTPAYSTHTASSVDKSSTPVSSNSESGTRPEEPQKSISAWSVPSQRKPDERKPYHSASYSNDLNKLILDKYYSRDLSSMTNLLNKHTPIGSYNLKKQNFDSMDNDEESEDDNGDDDEDANEDVSDKPQSYTYMRKPESNSYVDYSTKKGRLSGHLVSDLRLTPKNGDNTVYRLHNSPKVIRQYSARSSVPVRLQTAHSHSMPHYYVPHGYESGHHHSLSLPEKSGTWLGSGLAAGILIGAIPFGIMMASMMPTLLTGAMPIVNTAAVGKRRKRRSVDFKNIPFDQSFDNIGVLLRKGFTEIITLLNDQNKYMAKNNANSYQVNSNEPADVMKTVAKYALAAVDEPKCIKEMFCTLMAGGRNPKTTPLQKTLYILVKWLVNTVC